MITLWEHIDKQMDGKLKEMLIEWHSQKGYGTPTIAKNLQELGFEVEQRTVWRWIKIHNIPAKRRKRQ